MGAGLAFRAFLQPVLEPIAEAAARFIAVRALERGSQRRGEGRAVVCRLLGRESLCAAITLVVRPSRVSHGSGSQVSTNKPQNSSLAANGARRSALAPGNLRGRLIGGPSTPRGGADAPFANAYPETLQNVGGRKCSGLNCSRQAAFAGGSAAGAAKLQYISG